MKILIGMSLALVMGFVLWNSANSGEQKKDKEVTIKGQLACAKCALGKSEKCATVMIEKKEGKEIIYWFDAESMKKYDGEICSEVKDGSVIAKVSEEKDGKKLINVKEIKYDK